MSRESAGGVFVDCHSELLLKCLNKELLEKETNKKTIFLLAQD